MPRDLVFLLFVLAFAAIIWRYSADRKHVRLLQQEAMRSFQSTIVESTSDRLRFNGSTAVIERREESGGARGLFEAKADLAVTIYARNEFNERFIFKWHSKSQRPPLVKHLAASATAVE